MLDTPIQAVPNDQYQLLKRVIPTVLETSKESGTLQTRCLLEQGIPLAQAVRAVKVLARAGVLGPEEENRRTVNRTRAEMLLESLAKEGTNSPLILTEVGKRLLPKQKER